MCIDLYVVIKISILEEVSSLLEHVIYSTMCGYHTVGAPMKIYCVNEVQCGTGTEWSDLICQQSHVANQPSLHCTLIQISCTGYLVSGRSVTGIFHQYDRD